jgi:hypothetical protein
LTRAQRPGEVDPRSLTVTRIQLHHAAVLVSAMGRSLGARQSGFRHAALFWDRDNNALAGWPLQSLDGLRVQAALSFDPPEIRLLGEDGHRPVFTSIGLRGVTFDDVWRRLLAWLDSAGLDPARLALRTPSDLPAGPITTGKAFAPESAASAELGRWFAFAEERLEDAVRAHGVSLPIPCWPDHFDLATAIRLESPSAPRDAQVTLGFSPGDGTISEPYLYVTPWPLAPSRVAEVPAPAGGRWEVERWLGLALTGTAILAANDGVKTADAFLERGFEIARDLVLAT